MGQASASGGLTPVDLRRFLVQPLDASRQLPAPLQWFAMFVDLLQSHGTGAVSSGRDEEGEQLCSQTKNHTANKDCRRTLSPGDMMKEWLPNRLRWQRAQPTISHLPPADHPTAGHPRKRADSQS